MILNYTRACLFLSSVLALPERFLFAKLQLLRLVFLDCAGEDGLILATLNKLDTAVVGTIGCHLVDLSHV